MSLKSHKLTLWLIGAFTITFLFHFLPLIESLYPPGWDSYFYLVQAKSFIQEGQMHSSRISLFYSLLIGFSYVTNDYVLSYKLLVAIGASSIPALICYYGVRKNTHRFWLIIVIAWCCLSPHYHYFCSQFCKNALGTTFLLATLFSIFNKKWAYALLFTALSLLTHKLTGVISLVAFSVALIMIIPSNKRILLLIILLLSGISIPFLLPQIISFDDILRQTDIIQWTPTWMPLAFSTELASSISAFWHIEIWAMAFLALIFPYLLFRIKRRKEALIYSLTSLICLFPFLIWSKDGFAFRLLILLPILTLSMLVFLKEVKILSFVASLILIGISGFGYFNYHPKQYNPNYPEYAFVVRKLSNVIPPNFGGLIVTHRGLAEFITFNIDKDAMPWRADYFIPDSNYLRLAYIPKSKMVSLPDAVVQEISLNYYLLPESSWQATLKGLSINDQAYLTTWKNPQEVRPSFFKKYKVQKLSIKKP